MPHEFEIPRVFFRISLTLFLLCNLNFFWLKGLGILFLSFERGPTFEVSVTSHVLGMCTWQWSHSSRYPDKNTPYFVQKSQNTLFENLLKDRTCFILPFLYEHTTLVPWHFILFILVSSVALICSSAVEYTVVKITKFVQTLSGTFWPSKSAKVEFR